MVIPAVLMASVLVSGQGLISTLYGIDTPQPIA